MSRHDFVPRVDDVGTVHRWRAAVAHGNCVLVMGHRLMTRCGGFSRLSWFSSLRVSGFSMFSDASRKPGKPENPGNQKIGEAEHLENQKIWKPENQKTKSIGNTRNIIRKQKQWATPSLPPRSTRLVQCFLDGLRPLARPGNW